MKIKNAWLTINEPLISGNLKLLLEEENYVANELERSILASLLILSKCVK